MSAPVPSVTILTPVYNGAQFIEDTVDSVLSQGIASLEYIVLDDGSTDGTPDLLRRFGDAVRVLSHPNMGETRTVNKGFGLARGEVVAVVNADDPLRPGAIAALAGALAEDPSALLAYPDWAEIDAQSRVLREIRLPQYDLARMLGQFTVSMGPCVFIRKQALDAAGHRDTGFRFVGDLDLWLRLAMRGPFAHVPQVLATHRVHAAAASATARGSPIADELARLAAKCCDDPLLPEGLRRKRSAILAHGSFVASLHCGRDASARMRHLRAAASYSVPALLRACLAHLLHRVLLRIPLAMRNVLKRLLRRPQHETGQ